MSWLGSDFEAFFEKATRHSPYPYQKGLATSTIESRFISVPTGAGKTAAAILSWLYQRYRNPETTPRRLVYRLPMRVLVEETRDEAAGGPRNPANTGPAEADLAQYKVRAPVLKQTGCLWREANR